MTGYDPIFAEYESVVRSYPRSFPTTFTRAKGSIMYDSEGREFIDFFDGAGALNYGHNNDYIKDRVIDYLRNDGILHALDMQTVPKAEFIETLETKLLKPRGLNYKVMFCGPTGTNSIEAALKLSRKVKHRSTVWAMMGCFHGMTLGALSLTSQKADRAGAGVPLNNVVHIPAPYMFPELDTIKYMETLLSDDHSGCDVPAALFLETVQAEGGIHVFSEEWLRDVRAFCDRHDILLVVDDIQVGCARTGSFFSFERAGIVPDMVCLSKSIGAIGLPMAIVLFKPEYDIWAPGEHNGTFRGLQLAFVAAKAGIEFMLENNIENEVRRKEAIVRDFLEKNVKGSPVVREIRGLGLIWALETGSGDTAKALGKYCFEHGLIAEKCSRDGGALKLMPALTIPDEQLLRGLEIVRDAVRSLEKDQR